MNKQERVVQLKNKLQRGQLENGVREEVGNTEEENSREKEEHGHNAYVLVCVIVDILFLTPFCQGMCFGMEFIYSA